MLWGVENKINFALGMHAVFGKHRGVPCLFPLFNVHEIFVLILNHLFFYSFTTPGVRKKSMITFVGGSKFAKGGPNLLVNMDSQGSISTSGFGPGGPNPGGSKSARTPALNAKLS